eukprot:CAMPEP_0204018916 /NCGR_PEP_ID=MMETSP0360-20130528/28402_1 /ASSEMBLY_ACC=CAM_ASM_000342 /TAXON_ID=268821 /ORGANISM="Scrippsiella Hangoei, Strain SHTV-5" /LENGTH=52 /DNA_ID=CAMNT_0050962097 /DNA_START=67 /DNA_END=222 /DNA_ORIENTATION=+
MGAHSGGQAPKPRGAPLEVCIATNALYKFMCALAETLVVKSNPTAGAKSGQA